MISTYAELQTAVTNWLRRGGDSDLVTRAPELIILCEARFNRDLRHPSMLSQTDLTLTAGTPTIALPTDYLQTRALVTQTNPKRILRYVTPTQLDTNWPIGSTGIPTEYTIIGANIKLGKTPDSAYTLEHTYYKRITALSDSDTSNWILASHPDAYLYGALMQAAPYMSDDERIQTWGSFLKAAIDGMNGEAQRMAFSGAPLTASVGVYTG